MSETASKIKSSLSDDDAATLFDYDSLLVAKACAIWGNTNLTVSKLISILDHPNISSARIKAIFQVGCLVLPERIAAVLEGDQFAASDAATSVTGSFYTFAELASAFDHVNLLASNTASIFNHVNFDIGSLQAVKVLTLKYAGHKVGSGAHYYHIYQVPTFRKRL